MSIGSSTSVQSHHAVPPKKELEGAEAAGAHLAQVHPPVFGDNGVQLTEKQKNVSVFC